MTEKIPSSVKFGSRPRTFLMRSNSSGVRPCFATSSGVTTGSTLGVWLVIGTTLVNLDARSITDKKLVLIAASQNRPTHETDDRHPGVRLSPALRSLGEHQHNREALQ